MSNVNEAVVLLAKCGKHQKTNGMRVESADKDKWLVTWAFPIKDTAAKREGYDKVSIKGNIKFSEEYPGCPYCGGKAVTLCSCGKLNCTIIANGTFTCKWCGTHGQLGEYTGEVIKAGGDF